MPQARAGQGRHRYSLHLTCESRQNPELAILYRSRQRELAVDRPPVLGVRRGRQDRHKAESTSAAATLPTCRQMHKYTGLHLPLIGRFGRQPTIYSRFVIRAHLQCLYWVAWIGRSDP